MVKSPIKIIESGNAPTTANLSEGQIAFGTVDGAIKLYGSDGTTVSELGGGGGSEVNSIAPAKVSVGAESFDGGSYDSLAIGNNARADLDEVQYHAGSSLAVGNNSIASDQGSTAIGVSSNAISGMAIGYNSRARNNGTALGRTAKAEGLNSVAIGSRSEATLDNELSVGSDSLQRRITHVATPTDAQDAATKNYVDTKLASAGGNMIAVPDYANGVDIETGDLTNGLWTAPSNGVIVPHANYIGSGTPMSTVQSGIAAIYDAEATSTSSTGLIVFGFMFGGQGTCDGCQMPIPIEAGYKYASGKYSAAGMKQDVYTTGGTFYPYKFVEIS